MIMQSNEQIVAAKEESTALKEYVEKKLEERDRKLIEYIRNQQKKTVLETVFQ